LAEVGLTRPLIWTTILNLKSFLKSFNTGFRHNDFGFTSNGTSERRAREGFQQQSISRKEDGLGTDRFAYKAEVVRKTGWWKKAEEY
jgi:hypothetical protein